MFARYREDSASLATHLSGASTYAEAKKRLPRAFAFNEYKTPETALDFSQNYLSLARCLASVMREADGRRDFALAALTTATLLRWSHGKLLEADWSESRRSDSALHTRRGESAENVDEASSIGREALYSALEALSAGASASTSRGFGVEMDLTRIKEKIQEESGAASERQERDLIEQAARLLVQESDIDGAIALLHTKKSNAVRDRPRGGRHFSGGPARKKMLALCQHLQWIRRMRAVSKSNSTSVANATLPEFPPKSSGARSMVHAQDAMAVKYAKDALRLLQDASQHNEGDAMCAIAQAQIHVFQGKFIKARDSILSCLMKNPDDADANAAFAELLVHTHLSSFRKVEESELINACSAALRVDPTGMRPLKMYASLVKSSSIDRIKLDLLDAVATCIDVDPTNSWAWVMLATMLTGLRGLGSLPVRQSHVSKRSPSSSRNTSRENQSESRTRSTSMRNASSSRRSSKDDDSSSSDSDSEVEDELIGDFDFDAAASQYESALDPETVRDVFKERDWWIQVMFNEHKTRLRRFQKSSVILWRAKFVVSKVLFAGMRDTYEFRNVITARLRQHKERIDYDELMAGVIERCEERQGLYKAKGRTKRRRNSIDDVHEDEIILEKTTSKIDFTRRNARKRLDQALEDAENDENISDERLRELLNQHTISEFRNKLSKAKTNSKRTAKRQRSTVIRGSGTARQLRELEAAVARGEEIDSSLLTAVRNERMRQVENTRKYQREYMRKRRANAKSTNTTGLL